MRAKAASSSFHALSVAQVMKLVKASPAGVGLTSAEAALRKQKEGGNALTPPPKPSFLEKLWGQVNSALIWILIVASLISLYQNELAECFLILLVVVINVCIGLVQEGKAEEAASALSSMMAPHCTVVRDGVRRTIDAVDLVVGDIVFVQSGDRIPADLRMIDCTDLQILESMLTGESLAVTKTIGEVAEKAGVGDRKNLAFSATLVQQGQGTGVVVATGDQTQIGEINALVAGEAEKPSSLQVQLDTFGQLVTGLTVLIAVASFCLAVFYTGATYAEAFRSAVAIAVAIIPEGLPAVVTITLALGVNEMASQKAIVRKLPAVETLGSVVRRVLFF